MQIVNDEMFRRCSAALAMIECSAFAHAWEAIPEHYAANMLHEIAVRSIGYEAQGRPEPRAIAAAVSEVFDMASMRLFDGVVTVKGVN